MLSTGQSISLLSNHLPSGLDSDCRTLGAAKCFPVKHGSESLSNFFMAHDMYREAPPVGRGSPYTASTVFAHMFTVHEHVAKIFLLEIDVKLRRSEREGFRISSRGESERRSPRPRVRVALEGPAEDLEGSACRQRRDRPLDRRGTLSGMAFAPIETHGNGTYGSESSFRFLELSRSAAIRPRAMRRSRIF